MLGRQSPEAVMMVRPDHFGYNPETAASNSFQQAASEDEIEEIKIRAMREFYDLVTKLRSYDVEVIEFSSAEWGEIPDAVFPNNWVSFHHDGKVILYPMMALSRRKERRREYLSLIEKSFVVSQVIDLSDYENHGLYLEGTGSLVIDYINGIIYANHSPRTSETLVKKVAKILDFEYLLFKAVDEKGMDIYHTNVMMCVGDTFAVVCTEAIASPVERQKMEAILNTNKQELISITVHQMNHFAGNMMQLSSINGKRLLVMSESAYECLNMQQRQALSRHAELIYSPINTIEKYGGGSVRCMLAGIFLPRIAS